MSAIVRENENGAGKKTGPVLAEGLPTWYGYLTVLFGTAPILDSATARHVRHRRREARPSIS